MDPEFQKSLIIRLDCESGATEACTTVSTAKKLGGMGAASLVAGGAALTVRNNLKSKVTSYNEAVDAQTRELSARQARMDAIVEKINKDVGRLVRPDLSNESKTKVRLEIQERIKAIRAELDRPLSSPTDDIAVRQKALQLRQELAHKYGRILDRNFKSIEATISDPTARTLVGSVATETKKSLPPVDGRQLEYAKFYLNARIESRAKIAGSKIVKAAGRGGVLLAPVLFLANPMRLMLKSSGQPNELTFVEAFKVGSFIDFRADGRALLDPGGLEALFEDQERAEKLFNESPHVCEILQQAHDQLVMNYDKSPAEKIECDKFPVVKFHARTTSGWTPYSLDMSDKKIILDNNKAKHRLVVIQDAQNRLTWNDVERYDPAAFKVPVTFPSAAGYFTNNVRGCSAKDRGYQNQVRCEIGEDVYRGSKWIPQIWEYCSGTRYSAGSQAPAKVAK